MKKILFILLSALSVFISCNLTEQQRAESSVKSYLKDKLDDPSSYEDVEFTEVKPIYVDFKDFSTKNLEIHKQKELILEYRRKWEVEKEMGMYREYPMEQINDSINFYSRRLDDFYKDKYNKAEQDYLNSDRPQIGWIISHTFRANNKFGAKIKNNNIFYLNRDFSVDKVY